MRSYLEFSRKSFQKMLQYRMANLAGMATNFFFGTFRILVFSAFYRSQTDPQPLDLQQVITYVCLGQAFLTAIPMWGKPEMSLSIQDGSVAMQLIKPIDFQFQWLFNEIGKSAYFLVMRAIPTMILCKLIFNMTIPTDPIIWIAFLSSIAMAILLDHFFLIAIFSTTFWTLDSIGITTFAWTALTFFSGFIVPVSLWPSWLQTISSWLPFEAIINLPFGIYIGEMRGFEIFRVLLKQILWTITFLIIGRIVIKKGFGKLVIQGG